MEQETMGLDELQQGVDRQEGTQPKNTTPENVSYDDKQTENEQQNVTLRKKHGRKQPESRKGLILLIVVAVITVAAVVFALAKSHISPSEDLTAEVQAGIAYVQAHDTDDISLVQNTLKAIKQQKLDKQNDDQVNQRISALKSDPSTVWSMFDDYMILGDSRAVGFWYYDFLPSSRCPSDGGATIRDHLEVNLDNIFKQAPSNLYLCYGLNDISIKIWDSPEEWISEYKDILDSIHRNLPDTKVFVSSILAVVDPAFDYRPAWVNIPQYSAAEKAMCDELDYAYYVDNSDICEKYKSYWQEDGIHVGTGFYQYWAMNLIVATLQTQLSTSK